jgi:hypothetical protein
MCFWQSCSGKYILQFAAVMAVSTTVALNIAVHGLHGTGMTL